MTFTDNSCSGNEALGTMALRESSIDYIYTLTISKSSFLNNTSPKGSAFYSSLAIYIILVDLIITGNETTESDGFIFL